MIKNMILLKDIVSLIRVRQWYKNLVVFLALVFVGDLFAFDKMILSVEGFVVLCVVCSGVYVFNDIIDRRKDAKHPEKKSRPIASGRISVGWAILLGLVLLSLGLGGAFLVHAEFGLVVLALLLVNIFYTLFLKNVLFADILSIATLFVLRAVSGAVLISVKISAWLILCPFFLSVFMSVGKRHGDVALLGSRATQTRSVLLGYTPAVTSPLMIMSTTLLIMSYALYSFLSEHSFLLLTLPFALFVVFRYYYLIVIGSEIGRHPEKLWQDGVLLIGGILWVLVTLGVLYFQQFVHLV